MRASFGKTARTALGGTEKYLRTTLLSHQQSMRGTKDTVQGFPVTIEELLRSRGTHISMHKDEEDVCIAIPRTQSLLRTLIHSLAC